MALVPDTVQLWSKEGGTDRSGSDRVQPERTGSEQPGRDHVRREDQPGQPTVQRQAEITGGSAERQLF